MCEQGIWQAILCGQLVIIWGFLSACHILDEDPKFLCDLFFYQAQISPFPYLSLLGNQDCPFTLDSSCYIVSQGHFSFQDPMAAEEATAVVTLSPLLQLLSWSPHRWLIFPLLLGCCLFPQICAILRSGFPGDPPLVSPSAFLHKFHWTSVYVYGMFQTFGLVLMGSSQQHMLIPFLLDQKLVISQVSMHMRFFSWWLGTLGSWAGCISRFVFAKIPSFQGKLVFPIYWSAMPLPQFCQSHQ